MRSPAIDKLTATFRDLTRDNARLIKKIAAAANDAEALDAIINKSCPETREYVLRLNSNPYNSRMWRVTVALHAIDKLVEGHGVEGLGPQDSHNGYAPPYEYVNVGDTYTATLIYKRATDTLSIGCYGDVIERHPEWERGE